jgi:integrase
MKSYSEKRILPKAVKEEEFVKLIKAIPQKDKVARIAFLLGYGSGLRVSEVVKLKKDDLGTNQINIWEGKGKVDRVVPLPKLWKKWMYDEIPLKTSIRTLQRKFKQYAKKVGLPENYVFHSLRHGFGTRCVEQGIPINQIQIMMGHSSLSVTNVYTKARPKDALEKYQELF